MNTPPFPKSERRKLTECPSTALRFRTTKSSIKSSTIIEQTQLGTPWNNLFCFLLAMAIHSLKWFLYRMKKFPMTNHLFLARHPQEICEINAAAAIDNRWVFNNIFRFRLYWTSTMHFVVSESHFIGPLRDQNIMVGTLNERMVDSVLI